MTPLCRRSALLAVLSLLAAAPAAQAIDPGTALQLGGGFADFPVAPAANPPGTTVDAKPEADATIMVKLRDASADGAAAFARRHDLTVTRRFEAIRWVELRAGSRVGSLLGSLRADPDVLDTDAQRPGEVMAPDFTPRDPIFDTSDQGLKYQDGTPIGWYFTKTNFPAAWDAARGNAQTTVAIVDSEFDTEHPDLKTKFKTGYNVKSGTAEYHTGAVKMTASEIQQGCPVAHGSNVAGIVAAATDNNVGVAGAGFDSTIEPIRASFNFTGGAGAADSTFVADVTEGLLYIANNLATKPVVAVNMSFGTPRSHDPMRDALNLLYSRGVTLVAAGGNDQQSQPGVLKYPAAYDHVIAVAATQSNDEVATFSTNGDYIDVAAPGDRIFNTWDTGCQGEQVAPGQFLQGYKVESGTSMASPMVAGLVALIKAARPDLTPDEVESMIETTARDLGAGGKDPVYGAGIIDANAAVLKAKAYVRPVPPPPPPPPPPVVTPPVVTPPATTGPLVTVKGKPAYSGGKLTIKLSCPATEKFCTGTLSIRLGSRTLASKTFLIDKGKAKTLSVSFSKSKLRKAAKKKKGTVKLTFRAEARDANGAKRVTTKTLSAKL